MLNKGGQLTASFLSGRLSGPCVKLQLSSRVRI